VLQRLCILFLFAHVLTACSDRQHEVAIPFAPVFGEENLSCSGNTLALTDLRLYVSDVQLVSTDGILVDVRLHSDGQWQQPDLVLIDLEDGTGACVNGTSVMNTTLRGLVPAGEYRGLNFTVGVPFDRNHGDPLKADAPLGDSAMHWHWRAGYKFLRAGFRTADDGFWIHLGSTGCEGTVKNITGCRFPNRVQVSLDDFVPGQDIVAIDLAAFIADAALEDAVPTDCSSSPAEDSCATPFNALGLDFGTDLATQDQRVFGLKVRY